MPAGSGTIALEEFTDALSVASPRSPKEIEQLFDAIDVNGSGEIDYHEFLGATVSRCGSPMLRKSVRGAFKMLDGDKDGYITRHDLRRTLAGQLSEETLERTMACGDELGRVSYSAFEVAVLGVGRNVPASVEPTSQASSAPDSPIRSTGE